MTDSLNIKRYVYLLALLCASVFAQNSGNIHGVVTDPSGAVVPNAVVLVKGASADFTLKRMAAANTL